MSHPRPQLPKAGRVSAPEAGSQPSRTDAVLLLTAGRPAASPVIAAEGEDEEMSATSTKEDLAPVSGKFIWLLVLAMLGVYIAFVTPIAISLAVRVQALAPENEEFLGYIIGAGSLIAVLSGPIVGALSDRTRTRFGRRRPYIVAGGLLGLAALAVMAAAPSILVLGIGWMLAQLGWNNVLGMLTTVQADKLPESQRGKVAGLTGFTTMVGPVLGAGLGAALVTNNFLLFLVPGALGLVLLLIFVVFVRDNDNRGDIVEGTLSVRLILGKFLYNPRRYPSFSWNWAGRFLFMLGVTFNTTFSAFFFAQRAGSKVDQIAGIIAILSLGGVLAAGLGALGGGFISDKLQRRRVLVLGSGIIFAAGAVLMALAPSLTLVFVGAIITSLGLGAFSAVDQALVLDVLPEKQTDAGRFVGINNFSVTIPQAVAPLVAPLLLTLGASGSDKNYSLLYLVAAACTLAGGLIVLTRVKAAR